MAGTRNSSSSTVSLNVEPGRPMGMGGSKALFRALEPPIPAGHARAVKFTVQRYYPLGLIAAAAAINSSTSALNVAKQVTKRIVTADSAACSGQR
jgi:hypothetical protein